MADAPPPILIVDDEERSVEDDFAVSGATSPREALPARKR